MTESRRGLERRQVLAGSLALLAPWSSAHSAPAATFSTLSAALMPNQTIDPGLAGHYEQALRAGPHAAALDKLIELAGASSGNELLDRIKSEGLAEASDAVVAAWYSGMVGSRVVTYTDALAWNAVPFTKPAGYCGGAFGYWSEPPAG